MDAHQKMGLDAAGNRHASAETHEVVGIARKHGLHAGFGRNELGEAPCDLKYDDFFLRLPSSDGAGVFAPVPRIDHDDDLIIVLTLFGRDRL